MLKRLIYTVILLLIMPCFSLSAQEISEKNISDIIAGAERMDKYLPALKDKKIALLINQTARVGNALLLDTLLSKGAHIVKIFVPEHGLRGREDAGADIDNSKDNTTGLPIISLYGKNKKPTTEQLQDVDILIYDLQDVGVRFYTYISTLQYVLEACIENNKEIIVLDRPNPNGFYVDGPVLDTSVRSFVGMQPIPIVYGMTCGEYAKMLVGEQWIPNAGAKLTVIPCDNYNHAKKYWLRYPPSPNLKTMTAVYLYPSLCLFEGTVVSVGRGTELPFQQWGNPEFKGKTNYYFTPHSATGASKPMYEGSDCYGKIVTTSAKQSLQILRNKLNLQWLQQAYEWYPEKEKFFVPFFDKLAGTCQLKEQIKNKMTGAEIRRSWQPALSNFKKIRKKYLLYKDFE